MKLIYLVSGPMGRTPEGQAELGRRREYLQRHAAAGTEVDITDIPAGTGLHREHVRRIPLHPRDGEAGA